MIQFGMRWPLVSLDFESSALDRDSYPVEVGVAIWRGPVLPIVTWSSLIRPTPEWVRDGVWYKAAQDVHGISPHDLVAAPTVHRVMADLRSVMSGLDEALSDNPYWENLWLQRLATAAGDVPHFTIGSLVSHLGGMDINARIGMCKYHSKHPRPHRAGPDALLTLTAIAAGMRRDVEIVEWVPDRRPKA